MMTHAQAQQWIQAGLDGRGMAEEQWTALQRHLEACAECRNYQHSLQSMEAHLRRGLRQDAARLWPGLNGPRQDAAPRAVDWVRGANFRHKMAGLAWAAGALILLLALILGGGMLAPTLIPARQITETPTPTAPSPTPTGLGGFQGQVAYETRQDGNAEIYLLNAGSDPVNITHDPADDTAPSWSPDGEWLAFLSNRTGKTEVYVMHISGSRLTQLSDMPDVDWQGPISWAGDGSRLALIGRDRANGGQSWVYLVPVNDNTGQPMRVGYTRGARQVKFSPGKLWMAYQNGLGSPNNLLFYDLEQTQYVPFDFIPEAGMHVGASGEFDWSGDGRSLVYLRAGPFNGDTPAADAASQVRTVLELSISPMNQNLGDSAVAFGPDASTFRSVSWSVWASHVAYLKDTGDDCWTLHLTGASYPWEQPIQVPGLCIAAGLERANWLFNPAEAWQGWLVVTGHELGSMDEGLYALRVANPNNSGGESIPPRVVRLLPGADIIGAPRLRPAFSAGLMLVTIDPQPAAPPQAFPAPVAIPGDLAGRLLLGSSVDGYYSNMLTLRPDGQDRQVFDQPTGRETSCPTWSPGGARMAFLSDQESETKRVNEIFLMDADGGALQRLTQPRFPADVSPDPRVYPTPRYQCPFWSPDGQTLAAVVNTREAAYVAFVPVDGRPARYIHVSNPNYWSGLTWTPDSRGVLLVATLNPQPDSAVASLIFIDPDQITDDAQGRGIQTWFEADGWNDVYDLALSPDGRQLAFIGLDYERTGVTAALYLADAIEGTSSMTGRQPHKVLDIPIFQPRYNPQSLRWMPDGSLLFFVPRGTSWPVKNEIWRVDPLSGQQTTLAQFSEIVLSAAWSPDDAWVAYSAESGLYLLNLDAAKSGQAGPARLGDEAALDLDWR